MKIKTNFSIYFLKSLCFSFIALFTILPCESFAEQVVAEVDRNVFAITNGSIVNSNTTFIVSHEGVLVIDTRPNEDEAIKVIKAVRYVTSKPIKFVINTHFHGDHVFGNQMFDGSAAIIAHKNVNLFLEGKSGEDHLTMFKNLGTPGLEDTKIMLPNITYEKGLDIVFGGLKIELKHLGKGHTNSDTVIYIPEKKILITGDLVFNQKIPFAGHAFISEWIKRVESLEQMDAKIVIPGHGKVGDKTIISKMKQYLQDLKREVSESLKNGKSLEETKAEVTQNMGKYKTWQNFDNWLGGNIEKAYKEFSGK